jgi:hypothetical protein
LAGDASHCTTHTPTPSHPPKAGTPDYASAAPPARATHSQSVLNMVNCIMGVGVLGYPYCFKSSGLVLATAVMLATMLATRASYQLLLHCAHLSGRRTYEQVGPGLGRSVFWVVRCLVVFSPCSSPPTPPLLSLQKPLKVAEHATGKVGRFVLEICICASNLGCIVAYLNILADTLSSVAGTLIPPGAEPSRSTYMAGGWTRMGGGGGFSGWEGGALGSSPHQSHLIQNKPTPSPPPT